MNQSKSHCYPLRRAALAATLLALAVSAAVAAGASGHRP